MSGFIIIVEIEVNKMPHSYILLQTGMKAALCAMFIPMKCTLYSISV